MANNSRNNGKVMLRSTDRGGPISFIAGILCFALGFGLLIGINSAAFNISSATIVGLKNMSLGIGGVLFQMVPLFLLWLGALLCVSARHYVSFRRFVISVSIYTVLLAFLTMASSVAGFGSLMNYTLNMNEKLLMRPAPDSYGEFLARAYQKYDSKLSPLPGGGALGMLLAFPVWRLLGEVGGPILLGISLLALLFLLFRLNPVTFLHRIDRRLQGKQGSSAQPTPEQGSALRGPSRSKEDFPEQHEEGPGPYVPAQEAYYVEPQPAPVPNRGYAPYQAQAPAFPIQPAEPDEGFITASRDYFEPLEPAETRQMPKVQTRREPLRNQQLLPHELGLTDKKLTADETAMPIRADAQLPANQADPEREAKPAAAFERKGAQFAPAEPAEKLPWEEPDTEPFAPTAEEQPEKPAEPMRINTPRRTAIKDVGTAPAVELTGKPVPVRVPAEQKTGAMRMDGTPAPKTSTGQIGLRIDNYQRPPARLLSLPEPDEQPDTTQEDRDRAEKLIATLNSFNITAVVQQIVHGPAITRFAIRLAEGVNVNRLRNVMDNLAVELLAKSAIRAEIPIPGTPLIGIEVSNDKATKVHLSEVLLSPKMQEMKSPTAVALGKDIAGAPIICELMDMPHLLIAGATGSGKSVCINSIITSLLFRASPRDVRMILVDPKFVELQPYNEVPHLLLPVVVDPKKAVAALEWVCQEMDVRYHKLQKYGVRNIDAYNKKLAPDEEPMPRIIVIIDEMSDLMASAGKIIDEHVKRITAKARAAGICLILATQRPSVDVITGIIKANIPSRIAFQVSSQVDSRTILDSQGAEKLLGYGDMLYLPRSISAPKRVQGCFISDKDVGLVADYVKSRHQTEYNVDIMEHIERDEKQGNGAQPANGSASESTDEFDELLPQAIEMAVEAGQMSISMLQRVLRVGYGRAGRLIDEMARREIISGNEGTKPRKTLITRAEYQAMFGDEGFD